MQNLKWPAHMNASVQHSRKMPILSRMFYFVPVLFFCTEISADPIISTLNGTFSDGQTITLTGTGFGNGPNILLYDDFEMGDGKIGDIIPLSSPRIGQWTKYGQAQGRPRYHSMANSGTRGWAIRDKTLPLNEKHMGQFWQVLSNPTTEVFMSYQVLVPPGTTFSGASSPKTFPSESSWKFAWLFDGPSGYGGDGKADMCIPTHVGNGSFYFAGNDGNLVTNLGNSWWSWSGFNRISVWMRANSQNPTTANGDILFQAVNAEKGMRNVKYNDRPVFPSGATAKWDQFTVPGWWGNGDFSNFDGVYDDIYVAIGPNASARIEIGDAPTYEASRNLTIITPESWSANQIIATVRAGSFRSFGGSYIFVIDSNGKVSNGVPLCSYCPRSAINLSAM